MSNKENFLKLVTNDNASTLVGAKSRIKNRAMLRESQKIALKVLEKLSQLNWTQKDLAAALSVTPQQVSKIVSGKENLTIETQIKLQSVLDIPVLASYYEDKIKAVEQRIVTLEKRMEKIILQPIYEVAYEQATRVVTIEGQVVSDEIYQAAI